MRRLDSMLLIVCMAMTCFIVSEGQQEQVESVPAVLPPIWKTQMGPIGPKPEPEANSESASQDRGEVIQETESAKKDTEPKVSLPLDPVETLPPSLSSEFNSIEEFFAYGRPGRLVVLTANWCQPCQTYKQHMAGMDVGEEFDREIQLIDVDRYPRLYQLLRSENLIPQTIWMDGETVRRQTGAQSKQFLSQRLQSEQATESTNEAVEGQEVFWCRVHKRWEVRQR